MKSRTQFDTLEGLEAEVQRFEGQRLKSLRFAGGLESRFQAEAWMQRTQMLLVQGMLALCAYDLFIVGDYLMAPQHILRAAIVRFGIITPIVLLVALVVRKQRNRAVQEAAVAFLCVLGSASILYLHHDISLTVSVEAQTGQILVILVSNFMLRLEMVYAIGASCCCMLLDLLFLATDVHLTLSQKFTSGGMLFWVIALTLTANYTLTRERRYSYLLQLRGRLQRGLLAEANAELVSLSATDRLTGLANRRAYDAKFTELWVVAMEQRVPLSAVMVDVDHFKHLNDTHGHLYGDRVLQRIASLLQQALREENDFVARYGGEEFIVLLPDADSYAAAKVAERIRTLVQVAGSPALQRDAVAAPPERWATVSCGVATAYPAKGAEAARLIADADAAMYRAKQEGRNRVSVAHEAPSRGRLAVFPSTARV